MSNITIKEASITSGHGLRLTYTKREKDGSFTDSKSSFSAAVHEDLENAFSKLVPHLAISVDYIIPKEGQDIEKIKPDLLDSFKVSSITFLSEDSGVSFDGSRKVSIGKSIPVSSPTIKWDERDDKSYRYTSELAEVSELIKTEITAYLGGKHAPEAQQSLDFEGGAGADLEDAI